MRISKQFLLIASMAFAAGLPVSAQESKKDLNNPNLQQFERDRIAEQLRRQAADRQARNTEQVLRTRAETGGDQSSPVSVSAENKARAAQAEMYKEALEKLQKAPGDYRLRFADLLKNKKANLVRLHPDKDCDLLWAKVISPLDIERCRYVVPAAGGGSRYSFEKKSNYRFGVSPADVHFRAGELFAGNDFARGVIADLGDVDLLAVDLNAPALSFVKAFNPQATTGEVARQNALLDKGFDSNGVFYASRAAVKLNSTYVMRAVAYQPYETNPASGRPAEKLSRPLHDVLIAFKIVGIEPDGSIVLLWKKLN